MLFRDKKLEIMIVTIEFYLEKGWTVRVNNNDQVVFSAPEGTGFFALNSPTMREVGFVNDINRRTL